jgi:hypothetical protein
MSWNVLVAPQEDCNFNVTVCARETFGMATAATPPTPIPAAPVRNLRREVDFRAFVSAVAVTPSESLHATGIVHATLNPQANHHRQRLA